MKWKRIASGVDSVLISIPGVHYIAIESDVGSQWYQHASTISCGSAKYIIFSLLEYFYTFYRSTQYLIEMQWIIYHQLYNNNTKD